VDEHVPLRSVREMESLTKDRGVWVLHAGQSLPASITDKMLQELREERDLVILGDEPL